MSVLNELKKKLTSRKFWVTAVSLFAGIAQLFGADGELTGLICGSALSLFPVVAYILTEGKLDAQKKSDK